MKLKLWLRTRLGKFSCPGFEIPSALTNILIPHLTFGYHQAGE